MRSLCVHVIILVVLLACVCTHASQIALLIIDVQNCFMPGEPLGVEHGDTVAPVINGMREDYEYQFALVVLIQDLHCSNDVAFASQYRGKRPYEVVTINYNKRGRLCKGSNISHSYAVKCKRPRHQVRQILWPDHCVADTNNSHFVSELIRRDSDILLSKGDLCQLDTYSAFQYKGGFRDTGLHEILQKHNITIVFLTGLVLENSIYYSAADAMERNYSTYLVIDAIGTSDFWQRGPALYDLTERGATIIESGDLDIIFDNLMNSTSIASHIVSRDAQFIYLTLGVTFIVLNTFTRILNTCET